jgi:hypothetical protein
VTKACLQHLESQLVALHQPIHRIDPVASILQQLFKPTKVALHNIQRWVEAFSKLVDNDFSPWTLLQTPPKVSTIANWVCAVEVEVTQQKKDMTSLPPRECATQMLSITMRTNEITATRYEQQNMSDMISVVADKVLTLFT